MKKDVVAGLGEIGLPILKILSKKENIVGYDLNEKLMDKKKFNKLNEIPTSFLQLVLPSHLLPIPFSGGYSEHQLTFWTALI